MEQATVGPCKLILFDLSATIDHALLLAALKQCFGIEGMALMWYRSYMTERTKTFQVGVERSGTFVVSCSVSQGLVLGSLKFIAYTEDLSIVIDKRSVDPYS